MSDVRNLKSEIRHLNLKSTCPAGDFALAAVFVNNDGGNCFRDAGWPRRRSSGVMGRVCLRGAGRAVHGVPVGMSCVLH